MADTIMNHDGYFCSENDKDAIEKLEKMKKAVFRISTMCINANEVIDEFISYLKGDTRSMLKIMEDLENYLREIFEKPQDGELLE